MRREIFPKPAPLPLADRETAPYYVLIQVGALWGYGPKVATVFVKEGEFFRSQGGLRDTWGTHWKPVQAMSLDDARLKAHASEGTGCPVFTLQDEQAAELLISGEASS